MQSPLKIAQSIQEQLAVLPVGRLPSIRSFAAQFQCSIRTVQEAVKLLEASGLLESHSRSGIWRKGERPQRVFVVSKRSADFLFQQFRTDVLQGIYPWESPLPLIKELSIQWNCHSQTVRKVLEHALKSALIERRGRFFYLLRPKAKSTKSRPTILCLGAGAPDGHFRLDTDRESDFWREMGMQAALAGLSLVRQVWDGGKVHVPSGTTGIIATTWHYPDRLAICKALSTVKIPVCVWLDEAVLDATTRKYRIHYHDQGYSDENGAALAKYLIGLGHKHLAFITPWHANQWSIKRFQGIQKECVFNGCTIDLHALSGDSEWDRLIPAMEDPALGEKFPQAKIGRMVEGSSSRVRDFMASELGWNRIQKDMEPLFLAAFQSKATAWIGANDVCALNALKWLGQTQIAVAGFDDTVEALRSDLTSFRFSCASVARSMIYQILTQSKRSSLTRHKGMVVARASTRIHLRKAPSIS